MFFFQEVVGFFCLFSVPQASNQRRCSYFVPNHAEEPRRRGSESAEEVDQSYETRRSCCLRSSGHAFDSSTMCFKILSSLLFFIVTFPFTHPSIHPYCIELFGCCHLKGTVHPENLQRCDDLLAVKLVPVTRKKTHPGRSGWRLDFTTDELSR